MARSTIYTSTTLSSTTCDPTTFSESTASSLSTVSSDSTTCSNSTASSDSTASEFTSSKPAPRSIADLKSLKTIETTVDTESGGAAMINEIRAALHNQTQKPPCLYVDLEGVDLGRTGTVSFVQVMVRPINKVFLIDVHVLGEKAFTTKGKRGSTLKDILEEKSIHKVIYDCRTDSDALFAHFGVALAGVHDLQLMELSTRTFSKERLQGLETCVTQDLVDITDEERANFRANKEEGRRMFIPRFGGAWENLNKRPIPEEVMRYCVQDADIMPRLYVHYNAMMSRTWRRRMLQMSERRIQASQHCDYVGKGRHMSYGPDSWLKYHADWAGHTGGMYCECYTCEERCQGY